MLIHFVMYSSSSTQGSVKKILGLQNISTDDIELTALFDVTELTKEEAEKFEADGPGLASKAFGAIGTGIGTVGGVAKTGITGVGGVVGDGIGKVGGGIGKVGGAIGTGIGSVGGKLGGALGGVFKGGDAENQEIANLKWHIQELDVQIEKNKQ